jgi:beta-glucosidase
VKEVAVCVRELLEKMTLEEKVAQLESIPVGKLLTDGKFDIEKARELLKHGIGQITRSRRVGVDCRLRRQPK